MKRSHESFLDMHELVGLLVPKKNSFHSALYWRESELPFHMQSIRFRNLDNEMVTVHE